MKRPRELGDRGQDLVLLAIVWALVGTALLVKGWPESDHWVPLMYLGIPVRATVWYGAAVVALWAAFQRHGDKDRIGFAALAGAAVVRALSYGVALAVQPFELDPYYNHPDAWFDFITWAVISAFVMRQARRPELPEELKP